MQYSYHAGFKTREAAEQRLIDYMAEGAISEGEDPTVSSYAVTRNGKRVKRWSIWLSH